MSYKGEFEPTEILCPVKYQFVPLNERKLLDSAEIELATYLQKNPDMDFDNIDLEELVKNEVKLIINEKQFKIKQINPTYQKYFG